jgi:hypothetical protein|tara:strand:+ start:54 stop:239 length:186 start_codon:yes stop_codon:yes gene_type:complete
MQFQKNTSLSRSRNSLSMIIKIVLAIFAFFIIIVLLNKIDFPSPNKKIEKTIPNENLKIVK